MSYSLSIKTGVKKYNVDLKMQGCIRKNHVEPFSNNYKFYLGEYYCVDDFIDSTFPIEVVIHSGKAYRALSSLQHAAYVQVIYEKNEIDFIEMFTLDKSVYYDCHPLPYFWDYFISLSDLRKRKLKKIAHNV